MRQSNRANLNMLFDFAISGIISFAATADLAPSGELTLTISDLAAALLQSKPCQHATRRMPICSACYHAAVYYCVTENGLTDTAAQSDIIANDALACVLEYEHEYEQRIF